jgi:serine/threonine protein kinase
MNHYVLIKQLASGSYGQVFKAKHITSLQTVAIKVIKISYDEGHLMALLRELRALKSLTEDPENDHTIKLKDAFLQTGGALLSDGLLYYFLGRLS